MSFFSALLLVIMAMVMSGSLQAQEPLSNRIASYSMDVRLLTEEKKVEGTAELIWTNPSNDTIRELRFHLYLNGFASNQSTWMQEDQFFMEMAGEQWFQECNWGWIEVTSMQDETGSDLSEGFQFIQPDDGNPHDRTVLLVPLSEPVLPHETVKYSYSWESQIPKTAIRTGYNFDLYFMAQWFPKLGVYEHAGMRYAKTGRWNCHQYHANSEYYANFGVYDVRITVPSDYTVGASGVLLEKNESGNEISWHFRAEDVIDFTWSASPHFIVLEEEWHDVTIDLYLYPEHASFSDLFFEAAKHGFEFLYEHFGEYPYPNFTIIGLPIHGIFTGPMEYPTLITAFGSVLLPKGLKMTQTLVVHELVHQYFMQMVASNEQEEAWLDEGLTSYIESEIMNAWYGEKTSLIEIGPFRAGNLEYARHMCLASGIAFIEPGNLNSWEYPNDVYSAVSYDRPAMWLKTLEGLLGKEIFQEALRTYFETWRFRHPCGQDFIDVVNQVVEARVPDRWPDGMDWYFDQVLYGTGTCDFAVASISNIRSRGNLGYVSGYDDCLGVSDASEIVFVSTVRIVRNGEVRIPVEVQITFDDKSSVIEVWDARAGHKEFTFTGDRQISRVIVDPARKIILDTNFINNSRTVELQRKGLAAYSIKWLSGIQQFMETLSLMI